MIGDDDWASFYDPDEFGCSVSLVGDADTLSPPGRMLAKPELDRLRQGQRGGQTGPRVAVTERVLEIPASHLPDDWGQRRVELDIGTFTPVEILPIGHLRVGLVLVPFETRETTHAQWLRDPDGNP